MRFWPSLIPNARNRLGPVVGGLEGKGGLWQGGGRLGLRGGLG
ncbi:hypothetical protein [Desulfonatronum thiodismutans]|nr:hypothetical protein [Desulfonatronum thiodismutans]